MLVQKPPQMPRIVTVKANKHGVLSFFAAIPRELQAAAGKKSYRRSLETKNRREAAAKAAEAAAVFAAYLESLRSVPVDLTARQVAALAGVWYRAQSDALTDTSRLVEAFERLADYWKTLEHPEQAAPAVDDEAVRREARQLLASRSLKVSAASEAALVAAMARRLDDLGEALWATRIKGDWSPDPVRDKFPAWVPPATPQAPSVKLQGPTFGALVDAWERKASRERKSVREFRRIVEEFARHVGHDEAKRVAVPDVVQWRDKLRERGLTKKTINGKYLAALGACYATAVEEHAIERNPVPGARFQRPKGESRFEDSARPIPYSLKDATALIRAAETQTTPERRWLVPLLAYTGVRYREAVQSLGTDVRQDEGVWFLDIHEEHPWSNLKGAEGDTRQIPLHPALLTSGFVEYAQSLPKGAFLFPTLRPMSREADPSGYRAAVKWRKWVQSVVSGRGYRPAHSWRHRFKDALNGCCTDTELKERLLGHKRPMYGSGHTLAERAAVIERMPRL